MIGSIQMNCDDILIIANSFAGATSFIFLVRRVLGLIKDQTTWRLYAFSIKFAGIMIMINIYSDLIKDQTGHIDPEMRMMSIVYLGAILFLIIFPFEKLEINS